LEASPRNESLSRLKRAQRHARWALMSERLVPALWPTLGLLGVWLALALFGVPALLPGWLHGLLLLVFLLAAGVAVVLGWRTFSRPRDAEIERRIEDDSGLAHRPLSALHDTLSGGAEDPVAQALWQAHRRRMQAAARSLHVAAPRPVMPVRDPWALRAGIVIALLISVVAGWGEIPARLKRAVSPDFGLTAGAPPSLQVWLTPPAYTRLPPILLEPGTNPAEALKLPAGTSILALIHGGRGTAKLLVDEEETAFQRLDDGGQRLERQLEKGSSLAVEQRGNELARWPITVLRDIAPSISLGPFQVSERGQLRVEYDASDDFGLAKAWLVIRKARSVAPGFNVDLPMPRPGAKSIRHQAWLDLTAHPWAGLPVTVIPVARDQGNLEGMGEPVSLVLPERPFNHPVARALIAQRKILAAGEGNDIVRGSTIEVLDSLSRVPGAFGEDLVVFMAMRTAIFRLQRERTPEGLAGVMSLMWNTALRIEDGERALHEQALDQAERALQDALNQDNLAELDQLLNEYQQALAQMLQKLAENAQTMPMQEMPIDSNMRVMSAQELMQMVERIRELARTGSRESARQMLQELAQIMRNLQMGQMANNGQQQQAREAMEKMQDIARRQRELLDRAFRQSQRAQGERQPGESEDIAKMQEQLRRDLAEAMKQLGEAAGDLPESLGQAELAMRDAVGSLRRGAPGEATQSQGEALRLLQEGSRQAAQQMGRRMGQMGMPMPGQQPGRDPLGRQMRKGLGQNSDDGTVEVPTEADTHKAREILEELRRRVGEPHRQQPERDYLRRLLTPY